MKEGLLNGEFHIRSSDNKEFFRGRMKDSVRIGKAILVKEGKEYLVHYDQSGNEIGERKRTFKGVRLMIGNFLFWVH